MAKIFKYVIEPEGTVIGEGQIVVPLTVGWQGEDLVIWAEVEDWVYGKMMQPPAGLFVLPVPTGEDRPPSGFSYVGTAQPNSGSPDLFGVGIVMHVYSVPIRSR